MVQLIKEGMPVAGKDKDKQPERRRFEEKERKVWSEDDRKKYLEMRSKLAPFIRDLTTPAKEDKPKDVDWLESMFGSK